MPNLPGWLWFLIAVLVIILILWMVGHPVKIM
jgi:hypothetical protein